VLPVAFAHRVTEHTASPWCPCPVTLPHQALLELMTFPRKLRAAAGRAFGDGGAALIGEHAPDAMSYTASLARLGRAVAVTLVAAIHDRPRTRRAKARSARRWTYGCASASASAATSI
jgi:hypothetical protein